MRIEKKLLSVGSPAICFIIDKMDIVSREEAKEKGLTHYYTGKSCKYGHYATRSIKGRKCLECDRIDKKRIRLANPEKVREQKRAAYYKHIEKSLARRKRYIQNNRGAVNALNAALAVV